MRSGRVGVCMIACSPLSPGQRLRPQRGQRCWRKPHGVSAGAVDRANLERGSFVANTRLRGRGGSSIHGAGMALAVVATLALAAPSQAALGKGIHKIKHVVMIMQENRSFDSYFGTYPGANGIPAGTCVPDPLNGGCQAPFHDSNDKNFGGNHDAREAVVDDDGGRMDGFVAVAEKTMKCSPGELRCVPCSSPGALQSECVDVMGYHDAREIPNYWAYAQDFVLQDNMFESAASWSFPEHLYMVSGWSANCPKADPNPMDCEGTISPPPPRELQGNRPTNAWTDITYLLYRAHVSWRYYIFEGDEPDCESDEALSCAPVRQTPSTPGIWNQLPNFTDVQEDGQLEDIQSLSNFYSAVQEQSACGLPNVSWIVPNN
jgi:phospholipase C